jgi:hypothetical protein
MNSTRVNHHLVNVTETWTSELDTGQWAVHIKQWSVDRGQWVVDRWEWTVNSGQQTGRGSKQWTVDRGQWAVDRTTVDSKQWAANRQWAVNGGQCILGSLQWTEQQ